MSHMRWAHAVSHVKHSIARVVARVGGLGASFRGWSRDPGNEQKLRCKGTVGTVSLDSLAHTRFPVVGHQVIQAVLRGKENFGCDGDDLIEGRIVSRFRFYFDLHGLCTPPVRSPSQSWREFELFSVGPDYCQALRLDDQSVAGKMNVVYSDKSVGCPVTGGGSVGCAGRAIAKNITNRKTAKHKGLALVLIPEILLNVLSLSLGRN